MATASVSEKLEPMLNERDVARITGMSVQTIRRWRLSSGWAEVPEDRLGSPLQAQKTFWHGWSRGPRAASNR